MTQNCVICQSPFEARRQVDKTCSVECQIGHRRALNREKAKRHYDEHLRRPPRPDSICKGCGAGVPTPKTGPVRTWCTLCRANNEAQRAKGRQVGNRRNCYKCGVEVPEAIGRAGTAVCSSCRRSPERDRREYEQQRRLRRYGLTQDDYDEMLRSQGGRCAICRTDAPGPKGFTIDHCHGSGGVRAILCGACNTAFGLLRESVETARAMLAYAEQHKDMKI